MKNVKQKMCRVAVEHARGTRRASSRDRGRWEKLDSALKWETCVCPPLLHGSWSFGSLTVTMARAAYFYYPHFLEMIHLPEKQFLCVWNDSPAKRVTCLKSNFPLRILSSGTLGLPGWTSECPALSWPSAITPFFLFPFKPNLTWILDLY